MKLRQGFSSGKNFFFPENWHLWLRNVVKVAKGEEIPARVCAAQQF